MKNWLFFTFLLVMVQDVVSSDSEKENKFLGRVENLDGEYGQYSEIDDEMSCLFASSVFLRSLSPEASADIKSSSRATTQSRLTDNQSPVMIAGCETFISLSKVSAPSSHVTHVVSAAAATIENEKIESKAPFFKPGAFNSTVSKRPLSIEPEFAEKLHGGGQTSPRTASRSGAKSVSFDDKLIALPTEEQVKYKKVQQSRVEDVTRVEDRTGQSLIGKKSREAVAAALGISVLGKRDRHGSAAGPVQNLHKESLGKRSFSELVARP